MMWSDWTNLSRNLIRFPAVLATLLATANAPPAMAWGAGDDLMSALEAYSTARDEYNAKEAERNSRTSDAFSSVSGRREALELEKEIQAKGMNLREAKADYESAYAAWIQEMKPYTEIEQAARNMHKTLSEEYASSSGDEKIVIWRAMKAIELDIQKLYPSSMGQFGHVQNQVLSLLENGQPLNQVKAQIAGQIEIPAAQTFLGDLIGAVEEEARKTPKLKTYAVALKVLGSTSKFAKVTTLFAPESNDPLESSELSRLSSLVDVLGDFASVPGTATGLKIYKSVIEQFVGFTRFMKKDAALDNLRRLYVIAKTRPIAHGDDWQLINSALFGLPGPYPEIIPDKKKYKVGEPITGTWWGSRRYESDAWMGIVPHIMSHGSEEWADKYDIDYITIGNERDGGKFSFDNNLRKHQYSLRMYDSDSGGKEVFSVDFEVIEDTSKEQSSVPPSDNDKTAQFASDYAQGKGLTGMWSVSLFCDGTRYEAKVRVIETDSGIDAYMATSTPCIPAGGKKFSGPSMKEITCVGEESSKVGTRTYSDRLYSYPAKDNFRVCRRVFRKAMPET